MQVHSVNKEPNNTRLVTLNKIHLHLSYWAILSVSGHVQLCHQKLVKGAEPVPETHTPMSFEKGINRGKPYSANAERLLQTGDLVRLVTQ